MDLDASPGIRRIVALVCGSESFDFFGSLLARLTSSMAEGRAPLASAAIAKSTGWHGRVAFFENSGRPTETFLDFSSQDLDH